MVFYYLGATETWPDKKGSVWWEGHFKGGGDYCYLIHVIAFSFLIEASCTPFKCNKNQRNINLMDFNQD